MYRYEEVVRLVREWLDMGVLKPGDRLPSIRQMSAQCRVSPITVQHSYGLLESEGLIRSTSRSGYYVAEGQRLPVLSPGQLLDDHTIKSPGVDTSLQELFEAWQRRNLHGFGSLHISPDLLPTKDVTARYLRALREEVHRPLKAPAVSDYARLHEIICKRAFMRGEMVHPDDVLLTKDTQAALELGLSAITEPDDVVLVETPSYPPLYSAMKRRRLKAIELYSHPETGIDPAQFEHLMSHNDVNACVLMPRHHIPTGVSYKEETLRRIVDVATKLKVPVLEMTVYSGLHFNDRHHRSLKYFDEDGYVVQYVSFGETIGQRYGLGWLVSDRYRARIREYMSTVYQPSVDFALFSAVTSYMSHHSYDRHLRRLRDRLAERVRRGLSVISQNFPESCSVSRPDGGYFCWVRLPAAVDSIELAKAAIGRDVTVLPGPLFSLNGSFRNFLALNLSYPWDLASEAQLKWIGRYITEADNFG
ncbi:aminotransferase-like domain-containing protein [Bradyrhizobium sp. 1.29L]